jgi:hypothetical protein
MAIEMDAAIQKIADRARALHNEERRITMQSVQIVGELEDEKAWFHLGMTIEQLATYIGISSSQYYKRLKAYRVLKRHPKALELFDKGEVQVSQLSSIAGRITQANADILLDGIRNLTKRETEDFVNRVMPDGQLRRGEPVIEMTLRMTASQRSLFDRLLEVAAHRGKTFHITSALLLATECYLEEHDPMRRAERAASRDAAKLRREEEIAKQQREDAEIVEPEIKVADSLRDDYWEADEPPLINEAYEYYSAEELEQLTPLERCRKIYLEKLKNPRRTIRTSIRNRVWVRDGGQCTFTHGNGERCKSKMMLELDHIVMFCRGGENTEENLTLRCRYHNQFAAEKNLGVEFMKKKREEAAAKLRPNT